MRPGPGLVVMALAFISGARRGSTSTSSRSSSLSSSSSTLSSEYYSASTSRNEVEPSISLLFPTYLSGDNLFPKQDDSSSHYNPEVHEERVYYSRDYNFLYQQYKPLPPFVQSKNQQESSDKSLERLATLSSLGSRSRATRSTRITRGINSGAQSSASDVDGDADSEGDSDVVDNIIGVSTSSGSGVDGSGSREGKDGFLLNHDVGTDDISDGSVVESSGSGRSDGLLVQFPSTFADTSQSLDEDDILALVAEDDLLSEESFDRLKFADDNIGYINEDEYDFPEDATSSVRSQISQASPAKSHRLTKENQTGSENSNDSEGSSGSELANDEEYENDSSYAANLVASSTSNNIITRSILQSDSPLTRLNPWISACDLAQPGTAPDLQGQCSAGSLPVAWVDEGPGPPSCPISCQQMHLNKINNFNTKTNNNNVNNIVKTNNVNFKLFNNNNYHDTETMRKVRRDLTKQYKNASTTNPNGKTSSETVSTVKSMTSSPMNVKLVATGKPKAFKQNLRVSGTDGDDGGAHSAVALFLTSADLTQDYENRGNNVFRGGQVGLKFGDNIADHNNYAYYGKQELQSINEGRTKEQNKQQQQREQQCLDYLGDAEETSPAQLCKIKSSSELATRLRTLRLRHCCERNVFSALHTLALNDTLGGGAKCVRTLKDVMDLDILATRITCELAEILFRFDCRQIYSLIHQCDDCKEAYRRWVCSTLVPYFAEQSDVSPSKLNKSYNSNNKDSNGPKLKNKFNTDSKTTNHKSSANSSINGFDPLQSENDDSNKYRRDTINSGGDRRRKRHATVQNIRSSTASSSPKRWSFFDAIRDEVRLANMTKSLNDDTTETIMPPTSKQLKQSANDKCTPKEWLEQELSQQLQQSKNFISTANNAGPCVKDPVISNLMKRSKRKVEFRKRRRIRPCLSVCQTVEQKCPYLLPADRAPALPTQYAGEPTFLCLDQNIPETGEQLRKSSYGAPDCCYAYCGNVAQGICTYCDDFVNSSVDTGVPVATNSTRRTHNITLIATNQHQLDSRLAVALSNDTTNRRGSSIAIALINAKFAFYEGIYYYDENTSDMPEDAISDDCPPVPSVTSRCSIPYYASSAMAQRIQPTSNPLCGHHLLLWLSAFLCLMTSQTAALQVKQRRQQQLHIPAGYGAANMMATLTTACQGCNYRWRQLTHRDGSTGNVDMTANSIVALIIVKLTLQTFCICRNNSASNEFLNHDASATVSGRYCWKIVLKCRIRHKNINKFRRRRNTHKTFSQNCNRSIRSYDSSSSDYIGFLKDRYIQTILKAATYRIKNSKLNFSSNINYYRRRSYKNIRNCNTTNSDYKSNNNNNKIYNKNTASNCSSNQNNNKYKTNNNNNKNSKGKYNIHKSCCINRNNKSKKCRNDDNNYKNVKSVVKATKRNSMYNKYNVCRICRFYYYNFNTNDWWRRWWWIRLIIYHLFDSARKISRKQ